MHESWSLLDFLCVQTWANLYAMAEFMFCSRNTTPFLETNKTWPACYSSICKLLNFRFTDELQRNCPCNHCMPMSWLLAGTQPLGVPPASLGSKCSAPVTLRCTLNLIQATARDTSHVVIMGSKPITFMDQACSMILWKDTRSVSAETGKQWFLPIFPVNFKLLTWC